MSGSATEGVVLFVLKGLADGVGLLVTGSGGPGAANPLGKLLLGDTRLSAPLLEPTAKGNVFVHCNFSLAGRDRGSGVRGQ